MAERCEKLENKRRLSDSQSATGRKQALLSNKHMILSRKRKNDSKGGAVSPEGRAISHRILFLSLEAMEGGSWDCLALVTPFFCPLLNRNVYDCYPILTSHSLLRADNLFSSFTSTQMKRKFSPEWIKSRLSLIGDLDFSDDKTWDFWTNEIWVGIWILNWYWNGLILWRCWDGLNIFCIQDSMHLWAPESRLW